MNKTLSNQLIVIKINSLTLNSWRHVDETTKTYTITEFNDEYELSSKEQKQTMINVPDIGIHDQNIEHVLKCNHLGTFPNENNYSSKEIKISIEKLEPNK